MANQVNRMKIGEHLLAMGAIDQKTLDSALEMQKIRREALSRILMDLVDEQSIAQAFAAQVNAPLVHVTEETITAEALAMIPAKLAAKHCIIPVETDGHSLVVAFSNPLLPEAIDELNFATGKEIKTIVAVKSDILNAIAHHYNVTLDEGLQGLAEDGEPAVEIMRTRDEKKDDDESVDIDKLESMAELAPVVRFLNAILSDAINQRASDIHIEPGKTKVSIRYRVDGIMREAMTTEPHVLPTLVSRIKIISNMDISIRRRPQDGKAQIRLGGKPYDLRVSTLPTTYGEKATLRILDSAMAAIGLSDIGFSESNLQLMQGSIDSPQGIVLVTGPTGSGKSSTLYACLNHLKSPTVNIITLEDPVEYEMGGINQVSINPKAGLTFASGLRTILRQDPDIVMIGEIRDGETAEIACKASQTGHFVLSTLHTNDAPSAISRLLDLGIEPFAISSSLRAVVGQRLVRKICEHCKAPAEVPPQIANRITSYLAEHPGATFWQGTGCQHCKSSGYSGRMAIHEIMVITPQITEILNHGVSVYALKKAAIPGGYCTLTIDGLNKAREGLTSLEEVFRVAPPALGEAEIDTPATHADSAQPRLEGHRESIAMAEPATQVAREPAAEVSAQATRVSEMDTDIKVLIVDDDKMARRILQVTLKNKGFDTLEAENGAEGLKLAISERPRIVLTDYLMPELDGLGLVRALKQRAETKDIPIIMLTSKDEADSEIELMDAGVDDYLIKPVNAERLLARMGRLLRS